MRVPPCLKVFVAFGLTAIIVCSARTVPIGAAAPGVEPVTRLTRQALPCIAPGAGSVPATWTLNYSAGPTATDAAKVSGHGYAAEQWQCSYTTNDTDPKTTVLMILYRVPANATTIPVLDPNTPDLGCGITPADYPPQQAGPPVKPTGGWVSAASVIAATVFYVKVGNLGNGAELYFGKNRPMLEAIATAYVNLASTPTSTWAAKACLAQTISVTVAPPSLSNPPRGTPPNRRRGPSTPTVTVIRPGKITLTANGGASGRPLVASILGGANRSGGGCSIAPLAGPSQSATFQLSASSARSCVVRITQARTFGYLPAAWSNPPPVLEFK